MARFHPFMTSEEILGAIAGDVDETLADVAPSMTFALVIWVKGKHDEAEAIALLAHPDAKPNACAALRTAADAYEAEVSGA